MDYGWLLVVRFCAVMATALTVAAVCPTSARARVDVSTAHPLAVTAPTPAHTVTGPESAQELSLGALGLSAQSILGSSGSVGVFVPPPPAPLAGSGSFARVFFTHSPLLDASASSITVLVNGQPLTAQRLDASNADGGVFETRVPAPELRADRPNLLEAHFELKLSGAPAPGNSAAFATLEPSTLLHYQLYGPPGSRPPPRLESYPFPLAGRVDGGRLGMVLPRDPTEAEAGTALQITADLGRRSVPQQVQPEVVTTGAADWLKSAFAPALLVGSIGRLPLAGQVLKAAGFTGSPMGWSSPRGEAVGPGDGLLVTATSPFDGQSPVLLASGFSDEGLAADAAALASAPSGLLSGSYAIVHRPRPAVSGGPKLLPGASVPLEALSDQDGQSPAAGLRQLSLPFLAPPVDARGQGSLRLDLRRGELPAQPAAAATFLLNGQPVGPPREATAGSPPAIRATFPGALLRPGLNTLTLHYQAGQGAALAGGALTLPAAPPARAALELLPSPIFSDPGGVLVVLARRDEAVLGGAARTLAALGSRSVWLPSLRTMDAARAGDPALHRSSLVVVGGSGGNPALESLRGQLPAAAAASRQADGGALAEGTLPGARSHFLLWIEGSTPTLLQSAAAQLYRHPLQGTALGVDGAGQVYALAAGELAPPLSAPGLGLLIQVLVAAALATTALSVGWQVWKPRETLP